MTPPIRFYLADGQGPIDERDPGWQAPIPMDRRQAGGDGFGEGPDSFVYGDYFTGIRRFFEKAGDLSPLFFPDIKEGGTGTPPILGIEVFEEKHGALYHPARIEILTAGPSRPFVLNVALSEIGNRFIEREFETIRGLRETYPFPFLPRVYRFDQVQTGTRHLGMFLGEWFSGYCEFHWTVTAKGASPRLVAWDPEAGRKTLAPAEAASVFRQAAMLLTSYYHPFTFEHIASWHHAAGDFVLRMTESGNDVRQMDIRLISARQYIPLIKRAPVKSPNVDRETLIDALMLYFTHVTTRMRMDRQDGVGPLLMAPDECMAPVVSGFFDGLSLGAAALGLPDEFSDWAKGCIHAELPHQIDSLLDETIRSYPNDCEERQLLIEAFPAHRALIRDTLSKRS